MIYIPLLYFLFLSVFFYSRHKVCDICVYMSALYAFTSFCALLLVKCELLGAGGVLFDAKTLNLRFIPTILYCVLLTLTIIPFSKIYSYRLKEITLPSARMFTVFASFLFLIALLNLYLIADSTLDILRGDFQEVRSAHYVGDETMAQQKEKALPIILGYMYYFNKSTILALPMFFYSICFLQKPWWYNCGLLFISLTMPLAAIQTVDRTEFVFYAQMFLFCVILFRSFIGKNQWRYLKLFLFPFCVFLILYIGGVTIARFAERDSGAIGGALQYAGQGYLNFCYFYENANQDVKFVDRVFPFYAHFVLGQDYNNEIRQDAHGFFTPVFATFLGVFLLDVGVLNLIFWVLSYFILCNMFFPRNKTPIISFGQVLFFFSMGVIPVFGVFYYRYYNYHYSIMLMLMIVMCFCFHYKFKLK